MALWQANRLSGGYRSPCNLGQAAIPPRGPIDEIRIFVWRNGDWHPLPEEQQRQIKESLKSGHSVFKVKQGNGYWTLDTTGRNGWMQIGRTKRRPLKFVETPTEFPAGASPHSASSRGLNMRMPHGLAAKRGRCLVDSIHAEWEALAGIRESMRFEDFTKALRKSTISSGSRDPVELQAPRRMPSPGAVGDELLRAAVQELWADANLQPHEAMQRNDWLHLRLLEVQAPSRFALVGVSGAVREQGKLKGDGKLHWHLLDLFMLGCQRCKGPEDGLLSMVQLQELLRVAEGALPSRRNSEPSSPRGPRRAASTPPRLGPEEAPARARKPLQAPGAEPPAGRGARRQSAGGHEEATRSESLAQRVGRSLALCRSGVPEGEDDPTSSRQLEAEALLRSQAGQLRALLETCGERRLRALLDSCGEEEDFVTYYDFLNHMLDRKCCHVRLHQYDLSAGRAWWLSPVLLCRQVEGIWHTGVVVFDREYWYGGRIFESKVGQTPYGAPTKVIDMGESTMRSRQELWHFVQRELQYEFTVDNYDVLANNCNHFSDAVCSFLINQHIPEEVLRQPEMVLRTPVVSLLRGVLNHQLGGFGGEGGAPAPAAAAESATQPLRPGGGEGTGLDVPRSTCTLTAEEEWDQVQEGDLVYYEYEPGWTAVARVCARDVDACNLYWLDLRLGRLHAEEDVPSGAVRLLPGCGPRRDTGGRARHAARHHRSCGLCTA